MTLLSPEQFIGFFSASLLITLTPGPDNLMVLSLGASRGRAQGMAFGLGCAMGCLSHTLLAAVGISALIAASAWGFTALKVAGGSYLVFLGVQVWRSTFKAASTKSDRPVDGAMTGSASPRMLFAQGLVANAINPKVVMFFLAFLPQFVVPSQGDAPWQIVQLGVVFTVQAAVLFGLLGYFSGAIGQWMARNGQAGIWLDRVAGTVLAGLGLRLIISR